MSAPARGVRPSLYDVIFVIWAVVVPVGFGYRLLNSDGDLARHLRLGEIMLDQRALLTRDVFSFTKEGQPCAWSAGTTSSSSDSIDFPLRCACFSTK